MKRKCIVIVAAVACLTTLGFAQAQERIVSGTASELISKYSNAQAGTSGRVVRSAPVLRASYQAPVQVQVAPPRGSYAAQSARVVSNPTADLGRPAVYTRDTIDTQPSNYRVVERDSLYDEPEPVVRSVSSYHDEGDRYEQHYQPASHSSGYVYFSSGSCYPRRYHCYPRYYYVPCYYYAPRYYYPRYHHYPRSSWGYSHWNSWGGCGSGSSVSVGVWFGF